MSAAARTALFAALALGWGAMARGELALLDNGRVLKVESWREDGELLVLVLAGGGEVGVTPDRVHALLPDEIPAEGAPPSEAARPGLPGPAPTRDGVRALAARAAARHGVDPGLVLAVIAVESAFEPGAVSPKGAQGLMQLMPDTAAELGVSDAFDPEQNVDGGVRHLRELLDRYEGDLDRALAAYNAGAGAVERHGGIPPFQETQSYVDLIKRRYRRGDR